MGRGTLRIYLGAAPGVGKTFAMLGEGRRRRERGTDVVVGYVETHGRARTAEQVADLEVIPRRPVEYRGATFTEMDTGAILARRPEVVLVDELAHTNVPGSRHPKRWADVDDLLDAGIDVISTVNIQHLESINDVVESITGMKQRETIPDEIVRAAEQVELVDMTAEALRRRMAHGNVYAAEKVDAALAHYFRVGNLAALRELALLWVADQVDGALEDYRERHGISQPWETRERVVVALTGAPGNEALIRRAARIARRSHSTLLGVHVESGEGLRVAGGGTVLDAHRQLLAAMGGEYHATAGADVAAALVAFARAENATQIVLGASGRSKWQELVRGSVVNRVARLSAPIDVHVVSEPAPDAPAPSAATRRGPLGREGVRRGFPQSPIPPRRRAIGWGLALAGAPLLTLLLAQVRDEVALPSALLLFLALVVAAAAVGGRGPAFVAAGLGSLLTNWYFTPPFYELTIAEAQNVVALAVFVGVAAVTSSFVVVAARRTLDAARARTQAETLATLAATMGEDDPLLALLEHLTSALRLRGAAILRGAEAEPAGQWRVEAAAGEAPVTRPGDADAALDLLPGVVLALSGPHLPAADHFVLKAFAAQLGAVIERGRLRAEAGRARALAETNELRTALLQAVSHDLRTPLASIKAASSSLCADDVTWSGGEIREFATTIDEEADRLSALVANLLDMSRLQVGAMQPAMRAVGIDEVIAAALHSLGSRAACVDAEIGDDLPAVNADPALLERALANIIDNATRYSPPGRRVRVDAATVGGRVEVRVVDQGPGIPRAMREEVFHPFQRLGDRGRRSGRVDGVGLGLAVARGFTAAMGGTVEIDDTPGGGATVVVSLPGGAPGPVVP